MEYEIQNEKKSAEKLAEGVNEFLKKHSVTKGFFARDDIMRSIGTFIESFPVPSQKEDLIDFIIAMDERGKNDDGDFEDEYHSKWEESIKKAMILFPNDPDFAPIINLYQKEKEENENSIGALIHKKVMSVIKKWLS